jgi:hypothetical protein
MVEVSRTNPVEEKSRADPEESMIKKLKSGELRVYSRKKIPRPAAAGSRHSERHVLFFKRR